MISFETAEVFLPKYLSPENRKQLFSDIKNFRDKNVSYYFQVPDPEPLQGDGWTNVDFVDVEAVAKRKLNALVLSNSCDLAGDNQRKMPPRMIVSPLIRVSKLKDMLLKQGVDEAKVAQYLSEVSAQEITNVFFLPKGADLPEDFVVFLDNVQSPRLHSFNETKEKARMFTLSQFAFWLLLVKLAIHFCRAQEDIIRSAPPAPASGS